MSARLAAAQRLYPICDVDAVAGVGLDPLDFVEAVLGVRPGMLQLRAKHASEAEIVALCAEIAPRCRRAGVPFVLNDDPLLARRVGADGVHVGQGDAPAAWMREHAAELPYGRSTHSLAQLEAALQEDASYLALGPIFGTRTKLDAEPVVGVEVLRRARQLACGRRLVAIGGLDLDNAAEVAPNVDHVAVIGALLAPRGDAVQALAQAWVAALEKAGPC